MAVQWIRLTYLWADENVMLKDFQKNVSATMTDWAKEFYAPYGFDLDINPPFDMRRMGGVARNAKYALVKNGGIRPDLDLKRRLLDDRIKKSKELSDRAVVLVKQITDVQRQLDAAAADVDVKRTKKEALEAQLAGMAQNDPARPAIEKQAKQALQDENTALLQQLQVMKRSKQLGAAIDALFRELEGLEPRYNALLAQGDFETALRVQQTNTFNKSKIGSDRRLNIIFCDFQPDLDGKKADGETERPIDLTWNFGGAIVPIADPTWLWPYSFVVVDLEGQRRTIAHEMIHAAAHSGRPHPPPADIASMMEKFKGKLRVPPPPPRKSLFPGDEEPIEQGRLRPGWLEYVAQFEGLQGFYDGAYDDIMNYTIVDGDPKAYKLNDADKDLLSKAPFVVP